MKVAIIPARGGSKRLPGKNIKLLAGKPLLVWSIEAALDSGLFEHVYVSTDCEQIAQIAREAGAEVPFLRPEHLATDVATSNDVITHLVDYVEQHTHENVSVVALLQPTSPLRRSSHIKEAWQTFVEKEVDAVVSVCELEHPFQLCNKLGPDHSMLGFIRDNNNKRTQDLEVYYRLNGAIYLFKRHLVGNLAKIYSVPSCAYIMDKWSSVDIDDEFDFFFASAIAEYCVG